MTIKDKDVWDHYTDGIKLVSKKARAQPVAKTLSAKSALRKAAEQERPKVPKLDRGDVLKEASLPLERHREKLLRLGEISIEAKLDLHGMTQSEAFAALTDFMFKKTNAGKRHLLIITGKGREGTGVIRNNLQNWLGQLPEAPKVLAIRPAAPKHGGSGAFYVILRKKMDVK